MGNGYGFGGERGGGAGHSCFKQIEAFLERNSEPPPGLLTGWQSPGMIRDMSPLHFMAGYDGELVSTDEA